jgi:tetrahydromethanopterin S-methyltransferase subunit G
MIGPLLTELKIIIEEKFNEINRRLDRIERVLIEVKRLLVEFEENEE